MPAQEAVYLAATDKIYTVMANYIVKHNAVTGVREAAAKVCAPCYGPMRLAGKGSELFVGTGKDYSVNNWSYAGHELDPSNREIFNVDATSLAVTNPFEIGLKILTVIATPQPRFFINRIGCLVVSGDYLYFNWVYSTAAYIGRINTTNVADYVVNQLVSTSNELPEQFDTDTNFVWRCAPNSHNVAYFNGNLSSSSAIGSVSMSPHHAVSVAFIPASGKSYALVGNENLLRLDDYVAHTYTVLNLGAVYANVHPMRMRLHPDGIHLYIPCQDQNAVIIWDTNADTGTAVDGFDSPVDVVFTDTRIFAVQTGLQSLKEIV